MVSCSHVAVLFTGRVEAFVWGHSRTHGLEIEAGVVKAVGESVEDVFIP